jgi:hypothetical protein
VLHRYGLRPPGEGDRSATERGKENEMPTRFRRDDLLEAIGVTVLLIGTATGNAYAMLGLSVAALFLILAVFYRQ